MTNIITVSEGNTVPDVRTGENFGFSVTITDLRPSFSGKIDHFSYNLWFIFFIRSMFSLFILKTFGMLQMSVFLTGTLIYLDFPKT